jgi:hypothetical protein
MKHVEAKCLLCWLMALCLVAFLLAACINQGSSLSSATSLTPSPHKYIWLISNAALRLLEQTDPSGTLAKTYFDNPDTYLLGASTTGEPPDWLSVPTISFTSYATLQRAFEREMISPMVKAVVYDNESWRFTPVQEQRDPALYYRLAAQLVHQHHLLFIATPATDLVQLQASTQGTIYQRFLQLGFVAAAARYADIYEIQAQGSEMNLEQYKTFVKEAVMQAKAANPHVEVLAGLSTNPDGKKVTADELYRAVLATQDTVSGYWLNIPSGGAYCPGCGKPQVQVAISFLKELSSQGATAGN